MVRITHFASNTNTSTLIFLLLGIKTKIVWFLCKSISFASCGSLYILCLVLLIMYVDFSFLILHSGVLLCILDHFMLGKYNSLTCIIISNTKLAHSFIFLNSDINAFRFCFLIYASSFILCGSVRHCFINGV